MNRKKDLIIHRGNNSEATTSAVDLPAKAVLITFTKRLLPPVFHSLALRLSEYPPYIIAGFNGNIHFFGKSEVNDHRRLGVLLTRDISVEKAL